MTPRSTTSSKLEAYEGRGRVEVNVDSHVETLKSTTGYTGQPLTINFTNRFSTVVVICFIDQFGNIQENDRIESGENKLIIAFPGSAWVLRNGEEENLCAYQVPDDLDGNYHIAFYYEQDGTFSNRVLSNKYITKTNIEETITTLKSTGGREQVINIKNEHGDAITVTQINKDGVCKYYDTIAPYEFKTITGYVNTHYVLSKYGHNGISYLGIFCPTGDLKKGKAIELCIDSNEEVYCRKYHVSSRNRGEAVETEPDFELHDCRVRGTGNIARALLAYLGIEYKFVELREHEYQKLLEENEGSHGHQLLPFFIDERKEFVCQNIEADETIELRNDKKRGQSWLVRFVEIYRSNKS